MSDMKYISRYLTYKREKLDIKLRIHTKLMHLSSTQNTYSNMNSLSAGESQELSGLTCLGGDLSIVKIVESSARIAFPPIGWSTECNCTVWADGEVVLAVATRLDWVVELELVVATGDVSESTILIFERAIDQSESEVPWGAGGWCRGWWWRW